jgi:hypothetical protein
MKNIVYAPAALLWLFTTYGWFFDTSISYGERTGMYGCLGGLAVLTLLACARGLLLYF